MTRKLEELLDHSQHSPVSLTSADKAQLWQRIVSSANLVTPTRPPRLSLFRRHRSLRWWLVPVLPAGVGILVLLFHLATPTASHPSVIVSTNTITSQPPVQNTSVDTPMPGASSALTVSLPLTPRTIEDELLSTGRGGGMIDWLPVTSVTDQTSVVDWPSTVPIVSIVPLSDAMLRSQAQLLADFFHDTSVYHALDHGARQYTNSANVKSDDCLVYHRDRSWPSQLNHCWSISGNGVVHIEQLPGVAAIDGSQQARTILALLTHTSIDQVTAIETPAPITDLPAALHDVDAYLTLDVPVTGLSLPTASFRAYAALKDGQLVSFIAWPIMDTQLQTQSSVSLYSVDALLEQFKTDVALNSAQWSYIQAVEDSNPAVPVTTLTIDQVSVNYLSVVNNHKNGTTITLHPVIYIDAHATTDSMHRFRFTVSATPDTPFSALTPLDKLSAAL